jgi:hypothetical protein
VAGVFGAVDLVAVGFGVAVAFGVGVCVGFGLALVVVVVFGVDFAVVLGLVVGGTDVTVTVGGAVLDARVEELDDVTDPVGSSRGLTARFSAVADVGAATGIAPPPGTVVHAATAASPTTAIPRASTRVGRGRGNRTTRTGAFRGTSRGSGLVRTVLNSTSGADVNINAPDVARLISTRRPLGDGARARGASERSHATVRQRERSDETEGRQPKLDRRPSRRMSSRRSGGLLGEEHDEGEADGDEHRGVHSSRGRFTGGEGVVLKGPIYEIGSADEIAMVGCGERRMRGIGPVARYRYLRTRSVGRGGVDDWRGTRHPCFLSRPRSSVARRSVPRGGRRTPGSG